MTKFKISLQAALLLLFVFSISSCEKEDPDIDNGEELITTLIYTLTPEIQTDSVVVFSFQDLDGDGGNEPVIIEGALKANSSYTGQLTLRNEAESPIEEVNPEIEEEALDHQFFFQSNVGGLSIDYNDLDTASNPLGLQTQLTTTDSGSGTLTITLRHLPNKSATGVSDGEITNAGGETDIEVTFNIDVQ